MEHEAHDTVVVGTGPGGAAVARDLAARGESVLLLERGQDRPVTGGLAQTALELGTPGRGMLLTHGLVPTVRAITTGGSSIYYYGTAFEPPFEMLARHGVDISAEVESVRQELPTAPLEPDLIGPKATRLMASATDMGLDWRPLHKFVYQDEARRARDGEWLGYYMAPSYASKWNARMWVDEATAHGARLVTGAYVQRVVVSGGSGGEVAGVEYWGGGTRHVVAARRVVLAAGGIGSAAILLRSGVEGAGRDFFFDPLVTAVGEVPGVSSGAEIPMAAGVHCEDDGYMMTDMTVPHSLYMLMSAAAGRLDRLPKYSRSLQVMVKAKDSLGGHLTERGGVRKRLAAQDRAKLDHGYARAKRLLENAGARSVFRTSCMAAHPGGTVKIGDLVDSDLQTQYRGLYVCDASVIPEAWGIPPTLTLLGLGRRLAAHLAPADGASHTGLEQAERPV